MTNEAPVETPEPTPTGTTPTVITTIPPRKGAARIITPILALVATLVIGLFAGILIGHGTATASATGRLGFTQGQGIGGGTGAQGGLGTRGSSGTGGTAFGFGTTGKVVSVSGTSIVVKETSGTQVTVTTTSSTRVTKTTVSTSGGTTITKTTTTPVSALKAGETVRVIGATSGNTIAATAIVEGAGGGFGGFRPGGTTGGNN